MNDFLKEIIELKNLRLEKVKTEFPLAEIKEKALAMRKDVEAHRLRRALMNGDKINIIAEFKRASPSKGVINDQLDISEVVKIYERTGACAISVLTEEDRFQGSLADLRKARQTISLPVLRKDFIFDEYQIYESAAAGADVILLIAAMLDDEKLSDLYRLADETLGLDALVEVHTLAELNRAKKIGAKMIGVNNRNLNSFEVTLETSRELIVHAPPEALLISESGLKTREDLLELKNLGFRGFLIGESLMRSKNIEKALEELQK